MSVAAHETFPRPALWAVGALLAVTVASVGAARLAGFTSAPSLPAPIVAERELRFADKADGSVAVTDAGTGAAVATLAPNTNGFARGVMRGLARDRLSRRIGHAPPFLLTLDRAGKLRLQDTATGRRIELDAFGSDNRAAFAAFLATARSVRP